MGNEAVNNIYVTLQNSINSDGLWYPSISIYYSGCDKPIKCKDCHNPELQQFGNGFCTNSNQLIDDIEKNLIDWLDAFEVVALCFVGGEPLSHCNKDSVLTISKYFKNKYKDRICNIIYSWRYIEDLVGLEKYIKYMDYGVLGDFKYELKNLEYIPSSINQYIYNFNENIKVSAIKKGQ